ncbi:lefty2 [Ictalurus furcatus]|uniref:lefty2 n=1 Tax=Ictalurus furcatus TaxID=66913 RepID=UPI0023507744|nr:lefty2 [Ictalurus furcatus]
MALLIHLLLCATLISLAQTYSTEDMKKAILQKVGLTELPSIQKGDLENLVVPNHIKSKYLSMLKLHHARRRRSLPSLAGILRRIHGNIDITGEMKYSEMTRQHLVFDMESRLKENSEVAMAELKLYQTAPRKLPGTEKKKHRPVHHARVSIYWLCNESNHTSLVDSRLVPVNEVGWRSFDVTQAVHYWSKSLTKSPLHLEVRIEGERPGNYAAVMAKRVRFTMQNTPNNLDKTAGIPELILYTLNLEEYGSLGDCRRGANNQACCREEHYINFREVTWAQYWILEPAGYQAFRCAGGCKQPKRNYGYGPRSCSVVESAPLPVMYLVKKGDYTQIEVAEFPNMIVEKCGCSMDKISTA